MTTVPASGIAVIIPFYNGSAFLERSLASVLDQSLQADEIIVVNDGSRPEETEWLHKHCEKRGVAVLDKENGGQGSARNAGVAAAKSPYICFLDQDDFFLEHHNRILRDAVPADDQRFGWVYADLYQADAAGQVYKTETVKDRAHHPKKFLVKMLVEDMHILPSAALIDRAAFEAVGGFDTQFRGYEDDDLFTRLFRAGYTNIFVDRAVTVWCVNEGSTSFGIHMARSRLRYCLKLTRALPDVRDLNYMFMRDCIVPRFGKQILRDARRAQRPDHKFYDYRDEIYETAKECFSLMVGNKHVTWGQRRSLKGRWFIVRARRFGLLQALMGRT
ncbi:MAG: glycosyltransferase family 2 protein [Cereibacter sphaeroides]|uniref:Glycosyltransferase family 2 protein n=1 Tax=Cereibacter sphaeroides TaxID=1063 RepID=A0A2W5S7T9_CERSP|nr:MAG: glycosyltransferase family 2 protein [Cereibacter sphaeroides]